MADSSTLEWTKLILTSLGGGIALFVGIGQYVLTSSFTVRQPFIQKQTDLCLSASEHISRLATTTDKDQWKKSRDEFWMLYWGPLAVVEEGDDADSRVAASMVAAGNVLKTLGPEPTLPVEGLTGPSIAVAHACRDLMSSKWRTGIFRFLAGWLGFK
jgi:hypothetical protein